jgi:drug/metabolite transporter (DMT)-like permease
MRVLPTLALLGVTATWGSTFFMIKDLLEEVSVLDFLSVRFAMAAVVLWAISPRAVSRLSRDELKHGIVLGLVYGVAQVLQTTGLERTPATVSGFVTGMYVVATPIFAAVLLHERITRTIWVAVVISTIGLAFLSLSGFAVSFGVVIIFVSALLYALHIIGLGLWSRDTNAFGLAVVQTVVIAIVCTVITAPNGIETPVSVQGWTALIYMAVVSGALAMLGQTWAQAHMSSTRAAIIMTMEPVWAAFFAVLFGGESLTGRMLVGGCLVLAAMYIVELAPRRKIEVEVPHLTG